MSVDITTLNEGKPLILCSFRHLSLSFGSKVIFQDAELIINKGDRIGLLGLNGKGKSSLFKVLEGKVSPDQSQPPFTFDKSAQFSFFHVPQEIPTEIPLETSSSDLFWFFYPDLYETFKDLGEVNDLLSQNSDDEKLLKKQESLLHKLDHAGAWDFHQSYLSYCKSLGVEDEQLSLKEMSGGQRKKCLIALGLSHPYEMTFWDEPTNHLDIETIRSFEEELLSSDKTYVLTTHDRYLLGKTTNRIFQISNQQITSFDGSYTQYLELQAQKEVERLKLLNRLKNSFKREDAWMKQGIKARGTRSKKRVENFNNLKKDIQSVKESARRELELKVSSTHKKSKILVDVKDLSFSYGSSSESLFHSLSFDVYRGNKIGLIGPNGTGKTTLLKLISGALAPSEGKIKRAPDLEVCLFSQMRDELPLEKTPYELLGDGTDQVSLPGGGTQHVMSYFKSFLFDGGEIHRPLSTFSGGERNRLQLALNLKKPADIWIFDEPTNDLDLETQIILEKTLDQFKGSIILISHDRAFLKNVTNRLFVLENGILETFEGGYEQAEEYLEAKALEKVILKDHAKESTKNIPKAPEENPKPTKPKDTSKLEAEIEQTEALIGKIEGLINELGALQSNPESVEKLGQLSLKLEEKEEHLLTLYEKLELEKR